MVDAVVDQEHLDAILAVLNTALAGLGAEYKAYESDELQKLDAKGEKPDDYVEITLSRRYGDAPRRSARSSSGGWRITTRFVAHTFVSNARTMRSTVRSALEGRRLTVGDTNTTPVEFEGEDDIAPDDGWFSGLTTWTYARSTPTPH